MHRRVGLRMSVLFSDLATPPKAAGAVTPRQRLEEFDPTVATSNGEPKQPPPNLSLWTLFFAGFPQ
jgi:hypothetical protein